MFDLPGLASWHAYQYGSVAIIYAFSLEFTWKRMEMREKGEWREQWKIEDKETVDGVQ